MLKLRIKLLFISILALTGVIFIYNLFVSNVYINYMEVVNLSLFIGNASTHFKQGNRQNEQAIQLQSSKCKAIDASKSQFRVMLDGVTYPNIVPLYHNRSIDFDCLNDEQTTTKTILMWSKFKGSPLADYGFGVRQPFEAMNCPVTNCKLTNDRSKINESDLVLFHLRNKIDYFPVRHRTNQRFVHVIYESPINCHLCAAKNQADVFNYSASYRFDSDFTSLYWTDSNIYWDEPTPEHEAAAIDIHSQKSKFAAILTSNCKSHSQREAFIAELGQYIPVDVYGKCGAHSCPQERSVDCRQYIASMYKFYLAFENSLCYGYITEKLFDTLKYDIIPVVFGYANYSYYMPKSAYINAMDFRSPKDLAEFMIYVGENKAVYNSYFNWKKYIRVDTRRKSTGGYLCEMCIRLHLEHNIGVIEYKRLTMDDLKRMFGLFENCLDVSFSNVKYFNITELNRTIFTYYMSPER